MVGLLSIGGLSPVAWADTGCIHVYQCDDALAANKQRIVKACRDLQCTDEQVRLVLAVAMAETQGCDAKCRDASKDGTPSQNHSCFNLNQDMLQQVGWHLGGPDLNDDENVLHAIAYILAACHQYQVDGFLHFHRGGRTALNDGVSYGAQDYAHAMHEVMDYLAAHPEHLTDNWRVGFDLPHV